MIEYHGRAGLGSDAEPVRWVQQYWTLDGKNLLASRDDWADGERENEQKRQNAKRIDRERDLRGSETARKVASKHANDYAGALLEIAAVCEESKKQRRKIDPDSLRDILKNSVHAGQIRIMPDGDDG